MYSSQAVNRLNLRQLLLFYVYILDAIMDINCLSNHPQSTVFYSLENKIEYI